MKKGNKKTLLILLVVALIAGFAFFLYKTDLFQGYSRRTMERSPNERVAKEECKQSLEITDFDTYKYKTVEDSSGDKLLSLKGVTAGSKIYFKGEVKAECFESFEFYVKSLDPAFEESFECSNMFSYKSGDNIYPYFYCRMNSEFTAFPPESESNIILHVDAYYENDTGAKMSGSDDSPTIYMFNYK